MKIVPIIGCALAFSALVAQTPASRSVWDGVYTDEQAQRGQAVYSRECAACHGAALTGGEEAPPLTGGGFTANWNGLTAGDLFERIRISMPADRPGHLNREQIADVLAHIFKVNEFPAGKNELEHQVEWLKQIRFEATRPQK
jgi:mono/diheme cytochrome c family protein